MLPLPPRKRPPIMPPGHATEELELPIATPATPTRTDAATAATPTISRLRRRIALPLKRLAGLLELLLADLPAGQAPAQGVHRLVAGTRAREGAYREDDQCSKAAPEEEHRGCHQEPAPAVVVTPHHLAEPPLIR